MKGLKIFWLYFRWFTVGVSFLLSFCLFVLGISLLIDQFFTAGMLAIFVGLGFYSFSSILADDIRKDEGPDPDDPDDPDDLTTIYRFV